MTVATPEAEAGPASAPVASPVLPATQLFAWSLRRELWENRWLYLAPASVGGLVLFGFALSTIGLPHRRRALLSLAPAKIAAEVQRPYHMAAIAVMATMFVVGVVYCLGALYGERRDRSLLFWKSLPVSDLLTVLAKAAVPLAMLPALAASVALGVHWAMLLLTVAILAPAGLFPGPAAAQVPLLSMEASLLYGLATQTLWWAPLYAWLLLVSGWARRVPFLWAVLPPLALALVERIAFGSSHFGRFLGGRIVGGFGAAIDLPPLGMHAGARPHAEAAGSAALDPARFVSTPGLWLGLAGAAALLAAAVWLRRRQAPL